LENVALSCEAVGVTVWTCTPVPVDPHDGDATVLAKHLTT
jgi:hypothetical protein